MTNVGAGPLDVTGNPQAAVYQRVRTAGTLVDDHAVPVQHERADGHNHFHLMRIMRYSLRNASGAEVAPAQKVGFCLYDFAYSAAQSGNPYPRTKPAATVTLNVGTTTAAAVTITGAPTSMAAGTGRNSRQPSSTPPAASRGARAAAR